MRRRVDIVIREGTAVLKLLASKKRVSLVRKRAYIINGDKKIADKTTENKWVDGVVGEERYSDECNLIKIAENTAENRRKDEVGEGDIQMGITLLKTRQRIGGKME